MKAFLAKHWKKLAPLAGAALVLGAGYKCGDPCAAAAAKVIQAVSVEVGGE